MSPQAGSGQSPPEPDLSEFSHILKLSPTQKHYHPPPPPPHVPGHKQQQAKLYNPDTDSIPMRLAVVEPEASSESAGSSYAAWAPADSSRHNNRDASQHRQLFDPKARSRILLRSASTKTSAKVVWRLRFHFLGVLLRPICRLFQLHPLFWDDRGVVPAVFDIRYKTTPQRIQVECVLRSIHNSSLVLYLDRSMQHLSPSRTKGGP